MSGPSNHLDRLSHSRGEILSFITSRCLGKSINISNFSFSSFDDGGMGSFFAKILSAAHINEMEKELFAKAIYIDDDGVEVILDFYRVMEHYFEGDFWKVDFSELKVFPNSNMLENIECV